MSRYFTYMEQGILPSDKIVAKELVLTRDQYELVVEVLYHLEKDKTLRVIPPQSTRERLFDEVNGSKFITEVLRSEQAVLVAWHAKGHPVLVQSMFNLRYQTHWESYSSSTYSYSS